MAFGFWLELFSKAQTNIAAAALQLERSRPEEVGVDVCGGATKSRPTPLYFTSPGAVLMTLTGCHGRSRDDAANDTGFLLHAVSAEVEQHSCPTH